MHKFVMAIPAKGRNGLSSKDMVDQAALIMTRLFGGAWVTQGLGYYISEAEDTEIQPGYVIESVAFLAIDNVRATQKELEAFARDVKTHLNEEAVLLYRLPVESVVLV